VSLNGAMSNLVLAVLGAGQLTLPYAMSQLGLVFGVLSLLGFALLSVLSLHTLSVYEIHFTPGPTDCLDSYGELVVRVLGSLGCNICCLLVAIYAWGGAVSFMVILKGELSFLLSLLPSAADYSEELLSSMPSLFHESGSLLLILLALVIIWPLSALQDLSALKKFAPLGCIAATFITCVVTACAILPVSQALSVCKEKDNDTLLLWPTSFASAAAALPLLCFALNSSWAYIPILCTLREKTDSRVRTLILGSNTVIVINYLLLALNGYAMFCSSTKPNILESLGDAYFHRVGPGSDTWLGKFKHYAVLSARVSLAVQLTLALPMRFFVARKTVVGDA